MRFTVEREEFLRALRLVSGVVERKAAQVAPVLLNVLIQVEDNRFFLTTTDNDLELLANGTLFESTEPGKTTLSVRKTLDICRAIPEGALLKFEQEGERILLRSGRSRFTLSTLPADTFPAVNDTIEGDGFSLPAKSFKKVVEQTGFAMAEQDVRSYLNGMLLVITAGRLQSLSADGHRLAFSEVVAEGANNAMQAIIPRKSILELQRILPDTDESVFVTLGKSHLRVKTKEMVVVSKLLEGRFPNYEALLSVSGENVLTGNREHLKQSFQRALAVLNDKNKGALLKLSPTTVTLLAKNSEQDEVEEELMASYSGHDLDIGFNLKYLIDFLGTLQTQEVRFTFSDPDTSARVEGVGEDTTVYVIMPMRI